MRTSTIIVVSPSDISPIHTANLSGSYTGTSSTLAMLPSSVNQSVHPPVLPRSLLFIPHAQELTYAAFDLPQEHVQNPFRLTGESEGFGLLSGCSCMSLISLLLIPQAQELT